jgi:hypothetical protein
MSSLFQSNDNSGMGLMNDPLNFVKNLWGGMNVPGMATPTISVDELDKKITDLKTVESWLNVNMTMLKGTIQALEVQRATLATLTAMGESFAQQMNSVSAAAAAAASGSVPVAEKKDNNTQWPMPPSESSAPPAPAAAPEPVQKEQPAAAESKPELISPFANSASLWNMLQDQFKQAVSTVMETEKTIAAAASPVVSKAGQEKSQDLAASKAKSTASSTKNAAANEKSLGRTVAKPVSKPISKTSAPAKSPAKAKAVPKKVTAAPKAGKVAKP